MEEFKVIKSRSDAIYRRLLRVQDAVYEDDDVPNGNLLNKQFLLFQQKTLEATNKEMHDLQMQIFGLCVGEVAEAASEAPYLEFEQLYGELYVSLSTRIAEIDRKEDSLLFLPAKPAQAAPVSTTQYCVPPLKVPLPTFDGSYENWYAFKSMFQTVMARYKSESPAIKLYHLRNSLVGEAAGIIDQDIINNNDYTAAWVVLQNRFEDRRLIIDKHIDALLDLPKLSSESAVDLRKLIDVCTKNVDALKNLGFQVDGLGETMLLNRVASKLDSETRKAWEIQQKADELPDYVDTMEFLRARCRVLEKVCLTVKKNIAEKIQQAPEYTEMKVSSFVATTEHCSHCSGSHELWKCESFRKAPLTDRYETLRKIGGCFNCLQRGHRSAICTSKNTCKKCKKRHHTALHPDDKLSEQLEGTSMTKNSFESAQKPVAVIAVAQETDKIAQSTFCAQPKTETKEGYPIWLGVERSSPKQNFGTVHSFCTTIESHHNPTSKRTKQVGTAPRVRLKEIPVNAVPPSKLSSILPTTNYWRNDPLVGGTIRLLRQIHHGFTSLGCPGSRGQTEFLK